MRIDDKSCCFLHIERIGEMLIKSSSRCALMKKINGRAQNEDLKYFEEDGSPLGLECKDYTKTLKLKLRCSCAIFGSI